MAFEVEGEVEERLPEDAFRAQQEGDEEAAQPAISIQKRVNGFELDVGEGGFEQGPCLNWVVVEEFFHGSHAIEHSIRRGRDEAGISRAAAADPVLTAAELSWLL